MLWVIKKIYKIAGNLYWKVFGGFALSLIWIAIGSVFLISIAGFPIALKCFKIAFFVFKPFGKQVVTVFDSPIISLLWDSTFGAVLGIIAVLGAITALPWIITAPLSLQWIKIAKVSLFPFSSFIK